MKTKYRFVVVNMTGGKAEREALNFKGDQAARAMMLANDSLYQYGAVDGLLCVGMSHYQMKNLDRFMESRGYRKIIHPDFQFQKEPWRYTCLTAAYLKNSLDFTQIIYDDSKIETKYRYVAFVLPNQLEIRAMHIPMADVESPRAAEQVYRKEIMLDFENELEFFAESAESKAICCGDFNCQNEMLLCHDIYDNLPFKKLLDEKTWQDKKLDNVLISSALAKTNKVKAYTGAYRLGKTSDHKTVIFEVEI